MHSSRTKNIRYHHNGDFSGEIVLIIDPEKVEVAHNKVFVTVEFDDIRQMYCNYMAHKLVEKVEDLIGDPDAFEQHLTFKITP